MGTTQKAPKIGHYGAKYHIFRQHLTYVSFFSNMRYRYESAQLFFATTINSRTRRSHGWQLKLNCHKKKHKRTAMCYVLCADMFSQKKISAII